MSLFVLCFESLLANFLFWVGFDGFASCYMRVEGFGVQMWWVVLLCKVFWVCC